MPVLIYSGGLDSTVLLYKLAAEGRVSEALGFDYGQRHLKELDCARKNCAHLGVELRIVNLRSVRGLFGKNSLTDNSVAVPDGEYRASDMKSTVVPNRNMVMLSIAAARAIAIGDDAVAYAAHTGDHCVYPDCRPEFSKAMDSALKLCHYYPVRLLTPFSDVDKAAIVALGAGLGVDFSNTWSCYKGGRLHCGTCATCRERRDAFLRAGIADPTKYADLNGTETE